jgi:hypothetical protein
VPEYLRAAYLTHQQHEAAKAQNEQMREVVQQQVQNEKVCVPMTCQCCYEGTVGYVHHNPLCARSTLTGRARQHDRRIGTVFAQMRQ